MSNEQCSCDARGIGVQGVTCGDCPRDYKRPEPSAITDEMVACWRINYGLDKRSPEDAMRYWHDSYNGMAPAGAVAAVGLLLAEREQMREYAAQAVAAEREATK